MHAMTSRRFRFGLFELDAGTLDLRRDGSIVRLQAQPKQVLACLVKSADRTVSREELRKLVWGDQTFVDFERGLNFCIAQIRSALGDDAAQPTYIRTVPRQGYQFIAPVESIECVDLTTPDTRAPRRWQTAFVVVAAILLFTMGALAVYLLQFRHASKRTPVVAVVRFDNETSSPTMSRFSDELTDNFVEQLTSLSNGRYAVIGNAQILRGPRDARNLNTISESLRADFVVLGQVQEYHGETRILVHLIHMPEQTHVSVARMDRPMTNPLDLEAEAAQKIAFDFSQRLAAASGASPPAASH